MHKLLLQYDKKTKRPFKRAAAAKFCNDDLNRESDSEVENYDDDDDDDDVYEQNYVDQELKRYAKSVKQMDDAAIPSAGFSVVDGPENSLDFSNNTFEIYQNYNFQCKTDVKHDLPIDSYKAKILSNIDINQVVVIEGATGCGKSTQVAQYILDDMREKRQYCNIAVSQPRKIAAINITKRVCEERGWSLGSVCGYQVGLEKRTSPDVLITFMTTGVLLSKIIKAKSLREFTHIIIDEVHERDQDLDFLLLIVRKFLFTNSLQTKVVLMSATINADEFAYYFRTQQHAETINAPIIQIAKKSKFNKTIFYVDHILTNATVPQFDINKPEISPKIWDMFVFLIKVFDKLDEEVATEDGGTKVGSVLVFLPGIMEIEEANKLLQAQCRHQPHDHKEGAVRRHLKWDMVPLHSSLPNDEQAKAFAPQRPGYRKIILSTNIAESSVTVPESCYVIDFCLTKVMTVDAVTKYSSLKLEWASHVNCTQRAGRVGRTSDGRVYRLVSKSFYCEEMPKHTVPEMLRAPLQKIVLQAKMLDLNETPAQILALAMNPPHLRSITSTICQLKEVGAMLKTCRGIPSTSDGDVTFLGQVMANLPIDVHLAKLILLGQLYGVLNETIIIAAGCSIQNVFAIPFQQRLEAYKKLLLWSDNSQSDMIALLNLYQVWQARKRENAFENYRSELRWCQMNLVSLKGLREWNLLVSELETRLESLKIKETFGTAKVKLQSVDKPLVLKIVIAGAFYPNYFARLPESNDTHHQKEKEAVRVLNGRDPFTSVYFTGMDTTQPPQLYVRPIKMLLSDTEDNRQNIQIGFDGSSKVYVEFKDYLRGQPIAVHVGGVQMLTSSVSVGKIPNQVYEAIRKRQLRYPFTLKMLPNTKAWEFAEKVGIHRNAPPREIVLQKNDHCFSATVEYSPIPSLDTEYVRIVITNQIDAGHFWAQNCNAETDNVLQEIDAALNKRVLHVVDHVRLGGTYAAKYKEDNLFYRCKVIASVGHRSWQILFVDYGNVQHVQQDELFDLPAKAHCQVAPIAMECVLANIKPSVNKNPSLRWSPQINDMFKRETTGVLLFGKVYAVVDDVVHLELFRRDNNCASINEQMVKMGWAEPCQETFLSQQNHAQRLQVLQSENPHAEANRLGGDDNVVSYSDFQTPLIGTDFNTIHLRGPFNPLEMKLFSCVGSGTGKTVEIDGTSVNAVLLDSEPDSPHSKLVVAGYVGQSAEGNKLRLRQTTVMPSIPGFPMLCSLLFCPTMEPKLSTDRTETIAILCGLGCDERTSAPLYPAHDILLTLDTRLTSDEIEKVNRLRYLMNSGVKTMSQMYNNLSNQEELVQIQNSLNFFLFDLMNTRREPIERHNFVCRGSAWGKSTESATLLKPKAEQNSDVSNNIWHLLWFVKVNPLANQNIRKNLQEMDDMIYNTIPFKDVTCGLCLGELSNVYDLRYHLISKEHRQRLQQYYEQIRDDEDEEY